MAAFPSTACCSNTGSDTTKLVHLCVTVVMARAATTEQWSHEGVANNT